MFGCSMTLGALVGPMPHSVIDRVTRDDDDIASS